MKKLILIFLSISLFISASEAQIATYYVAPISTNPGYAAHQDSSYVAYDSTVASNNRLLFFIGGTGSKPLDFTDFINLAATLGYHAIDVAYPDTPEVATVCKNSPDSLCYALYRQQKCFGTPVSTANVDTLNSIVMRAYNLVAYLDSVYPTQGWGQYISGGQLVWSRVAISGHSQGSGHAMYIAKQMNCERVAMFSGVDDYSLYFNQPAQWLGLPGATPAQRLYGFNSISNEGVPFDTLLRMQNILGIIAYGDSVDVDSVLPPYRYSHSLCSDALPDHPTGSSYYHNCTVANFNTPLTASGTPLYTPVWTYMLTDTGAADTSSQVNGINTIQENQINVYPNPATNYLNILCTAGSSAVTDLQLVNAMGQVVLQKEYTLYAGPNMLSLPVLPDGLFVLRMNSGNEVLQRKIIVAH
jgi:hypothetical protein